MRIPLLLLLLAAVSPGEDVTFRAAKDAPLENLVESLHGVLGTTYLYPSAELAGKTLGGQYDFTVPRERMGDTADFLLRQAGLSVAEYPPVKVILPASALETRFRASDLKAEVEFDRGPGSWRGPEDAVSSLSKKSVEALLAEAAAGQPVALDILAAMGPRTPPIVTAVANMLGNPALKPKAAATLTRFGFAARPALPALREAAKADPALAGLVREIETARHPALLDPALATETAPQRYVVRFETTKGEFHVEVHRDWAPLAADRFWNLVRIGFFDGCRFFRVVPDFVAQFGKSGDPEVNKRWWAATIKDEPLSESNNRGFLSFAKGGPDSRATQVFVNLKDNAPLDRQGFPAFGRVVKGMDVVDALHSGYGDTPDQGQIHFKGEEYLKLNFPKLDKIKAATIVE